MYIHPRTPLSLLLCHEVGGKAFPLARISAPGLIDRVLARAIQEKLAETEQATDPLARRKAEQEAELLQAAR